MKTIPFPFWLPFPTLANSLAGVAVGAKAMHLQPDQVIRLDRSCRVSGIAVERGVVWVTDTPAGRDLLLRQGENLPARGGWPVVVQALSESVIRLS